jgi:gluconate 5-dehydrogenase
MKGFTMSNLFSLNEKVALVTGATGGIGWAIAKSMAKQGAHVILNGRRVDALRERATELSRSGLSVSTSLFDVTDLVTVKAEVERVAADCGRLDILVNNAGINSRQPFLEYSDQTYWKIINTNLTACFVVSREAARWMVSKGSGRIINIASNVVCVSRPLNSVYGASKGGIVGLTRTLAVELGPQGITCNAIAPGFTVTAATEVSLKDDKFKEYIVSRTPLGRWGQPEDMVGAALFLASDASSFLTGQLLTVDGGMSVAL